MGLWWGDKEGKKEWERENHTFPFFSFIYPTCQQLQRNESEHH